MLNPRTIHNGTSSANAEGVVRYWGRKSRNLAQFYIQRFTKPHEVVADLFGGSGIFVKAALDVDRRAIYVDLNPFAHLIAKTTIAPCDLAEFVKATAALLSEPQVRFRRKRTFACEGSKFFSIRCKCGRWTEADSITYGRKYRRLRPVSLGLNETSQSVYKSIPLRGITHSALVSLHPELDSQTVTRVVKTLAKSRLVREVEFVVGSRFVSQCSCGRRGLSLPITIDWLVGGKVKPKLTPPHNKLEYSDGTPFLKRRDVSRLSELFTARNLAILTSLWDDIQGLRVKTDVKDCLRLAFLGTLARSSKMCREEGGSWPVNSYWIPRTYTVRNPYRVFRRAVGRISSLLRRHQQVTVGTSEEVLSGMADVSFLLEDATRTKFPRRSLDYVLVDPPHSDEAQYFELSLFYTSWLNKRLNFGREVIINTNRRKDAMGYFDMLRRASKLIRNSLKPGGYYTLILHDTNRTFVKRCADTIQEIGLGLVADEIVDGYSIFTFKK